MFVPPSKIGIEICGANDHAAEPGLNNPPSDGDKVPKGTFRYPEDKTPKHVDDKWDIYWQTHTIDEHGAIIKAPQDS